MKKQVNIGDEIVFTNPDDTIPEGERGIITEIVGAWTYEALFPKYKPRCPWKETWTISGENFKLTTEEESIIDLKMENIALKAQLQLVKDLIGMLCEKGVINVGQD